MATTSKTLNPYTAARQEWDERYGDLISRAKNWRLIAFLSMSTTLVCVTGHGHNWLPVAHRSLCSCAG